VVVATGVPGDGRREVLGFAVGDSEDGAFWTASLRSLKARGLAGVQLVIADAHLGLHQAVQAVMAGAAIRTNFAQPDATHMHEPLDVIAGMLAASSPSSSACSATAPRTCWP
jgi:putative transposase